MAFKKEEFLLRISHVRIIQAVYELNLTSHYPNKDGIQKVLNGEIDQDTKEHQNLMSFGSSLSFQGRRLASQITVLVRRGYLAYVYDNNTDQCFLKATTKGIADLEAYKSTHKVSFEKKNAVSKQTIVKIKL